MTPPSLTDLPTLDIEIPEYPHGPHPFSKGHRDVLSEALPQCPFSIGRRSGLYLLNL
jgi:hypothetical protein